MVQKAAFKILGISDPVNAYALEQFLMCKNGVKKAFLSATLDELSVVYDSNLTKEDIYLMISKRGYHAKDVEAEKPESIEFARQKELHSLLLHFISAIIMTVPVVFLSYFPDLVPIIRHHVLKISIFGSIYFASYINLLLVGLTTAIIFISGHRIYTGALKALKNKTTNMDVLITIGILSIYFYSIASIIFVLEKQYFDTAALIVSFLLFGRLLESKIRLKESRGKSPIAMPKTLRVRKKSDYQSKTLGDIRLDDEILVEPEDVIPVDGEIIEGYSIVDESSITGENMPREKKSGDYVFAGSKNSTGIIIVKAKQIGNDTVIANIMNLQSQAHTDKSQIQKLADRTARVYVPLILLIGMITFVGWFINDVAFAIALTALASIFVIATPSTLALATPMAILVGMNIGSKNGILFRSGTTIETLSKVDTVILSKEGIITERLYHLNEAIRIGKEKRDIVRLALVYLHNSEHEIAQALRSYAKNHKLKNSKRGKIEKVQTFSNGVKTKSAKKTVVIGDKSFLHENGVSVSGIEADVLHYETKGKTVWIIAQEEKLIGMLVFTSPLKDFSLMSALELKKGRYDTYVSSREPRQSTKAVAMEVGFQNILPNMTQSKLTREIANMQQNGKVVAYVTDSNDESEPLSQADVGISMGDFSNISKSASDVFLFKDDPRDYIVALQLSNKTFKKVKTNIFWSLAYNVAAIPLAAGVLYPFFGIMLRPELAASMMVLSSMSILLNSVGLKNYVPDIKKFDVTSFRA